MRNSTHDYAGWYRTILKDFVCDVLGADSFKQRGLFDLCQVQKLMQEHFAGIKDYTHQISTLITFELWARQFLDGSN